jgi:hypothetical protein
LSIGIITEQHLLVDDSFDMVAFLPVLVDERNCIKLPHNGQFHHIVGSRNRSGQRIDITRLFGARWLIIYDIEGVSMKHAMLHAHSLNITYYVSPSAAAT